ncbi:MAG: recombinase family protein [Brevundimonas sp.]|uniref:recombinase family protein n=1 Tax=Brevundimonas sp. TaxID=1871086 RepID=UPI003919957A
MSSRTFVYARVSTLGQTTDNQIQEIKAAGFSVEEKRIVTETISGSTSAMERPAFAALVAHKLEPGDVLLVTKLDRLGRNAMDVRATVDSLAAMGVKVHCLALGCADLTSAAGRMTMGVLAAVAEFERDLLIERTQAGLVRAKGEGKTLGRPALFSEAQRREIAQRRQSGETLGTLAAEYKVDRSAIQRAVKSVTGDLGTVIFG